MSLGSIGITINGVDRTDWLSYASQVNWNVMRGTRGTCTLPFEVHPGDSFAPQVGESLLLYDASVCVWAGVVDTVEITWHGDAGYHLIVLTGITLESLFDTAQLANIEYAGLTAGAIFAAIYTASGVTAVTLGTVSDGPSVETLKVAGVAKAFTDLATLAGFVWYVDPADQKLYFHAPADRAGISLVSTDVLWETLDWEQSAADFRDAQVIELPGVAVENVTESFAASLTNIYTLSQMPAYLVSVVVTPGGLGGATVAWSPGTLIVGVTVAPGSTIAITYVPASASEVVVGAALGTGKNSRRYIRTDQFISAGAIQEATAMLAQYSMLPSTLNFQTDTPGVQIARAITLTFDFPIEAGGLLNGTWLVLEADATVVPGLDQRAEPFGHWRYTIYVVNSEATAIFPGNGVTTAFVAPGVVSAAKISNNPLPGGAPVAYDITPSGPDITVTPAPAAGQTLVATYTPVNGNPTSPTFVQTLAGIVGTQVSPAGQSAPMSGSGGGGGATVSDTDIYIRTLLLKDTTVLNDVADHVPVYHDGIGVRILGVCRRAITADLTVRFNKAGSEMITVTIPSSTAVDSVIEWPLLEGSPATAVTFWDKEVLSADILASDGLIDPDGVASFTIEWSSTETLS